MSSSESSSGHSSSGSRGSTDLLHMAQRVQRRLSSPATETMPVADHRRATETMLAMRDALLAGEEPAPAVRMALTCAGVALRRRVAFGDTGVVGELQNFTTTMALLFVLVVLCSGDSQRSPTPPTPPPRPSGDGDGDGKDEDEGGGEGGEGGAERDEAMAIAGWQNSTLESEIRAADGAATDGWSAALRSPGALCQACLRDATRRSNAMSLDELSSVGGLFFRASASAMAISMLDGAGRPAGGDADAFLSLDAMAFVAQANNNLDERLLSVADCAESESGQTVRLYDYTATDPNPNPPFLRRSVTDPA